MRKFLTGLAIAAALAPAMAAAATGAASSSSAASSSEHPSSKHTTNLPPSADLLYRISAKQRGFSLNGDATVQWRQGDGKYLITTVSHAGILGKILDNRSEGEVDDYGLAPLSFYEKRGRKEATTAYFKRDAKTISFSKGDESYPIKGGEQDRTSAPWQLLSIARATPEKFTPGSEWAFFVAGHTDGEAWVFKVVKREKIQTGLGELDTVHFVKSPPKNDHSQQVDLWLAPSQDWYPVRIRFLDEDGDYVDQVIDKVARK